MSVRSRRRVPVALLVTALCSVGLLAAATTAGAADVKKTMTVNAPLTTVATAAAGDNMRVTFTGLVGQVVTVATSGGTFASNCDANLSVVKSDGVTVVAGPVCGGIGGTIPGVTIPANANYQVLVDPVGTAVGSVKVAITSASSTKSITPGAPPVTATITANGSVDFGFVGGANKFVAFRATAGSFANVCALSGEIRKPDGTALAASSCIGTGTVFVEPATQPTGGVYKLRVTSTAAAAGTVKLQLWSAANITSTITPGAAPILAKTTTPGQVATYSFSATTGQNLTVDLAASTYATAYLALIRPDGTTLSSSFFATGTSFFDAQVLDATGTWKVRVDPTAATTGQTNLAIDFVADTGGTITIDGPAKTATVTTSGQDVSWTFSGTSGTRVTTTWSASTIPASNLVFRRPNGTVFLSNFVGTGSGFIDPIVLDATGTWTLVIDPTGTNTGAVTIRLASVTDLTGSLSLGVAKTTTIAQAGQRASYTFSATTGQRLTNTWSASTIPAGYFSIARPNGTAAANQFLSNGAGFVDPIVLDATGTWTVTVDPTGANTGSVTFTLAAVADVTGTLSMGTAKAATISQAGQRALYSFSATSGQRITNTWTGSTVAGAYFVFVRPNGTTLANQFFSTGAGFADPVVLDATGIWTVIVDPSGASTGTVTFTVAAVTDVTGSITPGGAAVGVTISKAGQRALLTFSGTSGQGRTMHVAGSTIPSGYVSLLAPNGSVAQSCFFATGATNCSTFTLNATGTWTVVLDPSGNGTGSANISLT